MGKFTTVDNYLEKYKYILLSRKGAALMFPSDKEFLDAFLAENPDPKYVGKPIAIDMYMHRDWDSYIQYGLNTTDPRKEMY